MILLLLLPKEFFVTKLDSYESAILRLTGLLCRKASRVEEVEEVVVGEAVHPG